MSATMRSPSGAPLSIGLVGTYPPTRCGIATFTASLRRALEGPGGRYHLPVVSCAERPAARAHPPEVVAELVSGSRRSRATAVDQLDETDVVILQHEFGIYGGDNGSEVLDLVAELSVPVIVVLHTVPRTPSPGQRAILEELTASAAAVVVQSAAARRQLLATHVVERRDIHLIRHGARPNLKPVAAADGAAHAPLVLTWGLLGPDKGIELGIEAISRLGDLRPAPRYLILGQTHPKIVETHGERYREALTQLSRELEVTDRVVFENGYGDTETILARVREADVVLLPYRSREQVVSGVLAEAIASGTPVVATRFPHAEEVLAAGSGLLVEHGDAQAVERALRALLGNRTQLDRATAAARTQAPTFFWETVAHDYRMLARDLATRAAGAVA